MRARRSKKSCADFARGDRKRVIATISLIETDELFPLIESDLREYIKLIPIFSEEYWPRQSSPSSIPIAKTLKASLNARDTKKTIEMLIKWLYKVRYNLVHGDKSYYDGNQRKLLEMSSLLLDKILWHLKSRYP